MTKEMINREKRRSILKKEFTTSASFIEKLDDKDLQDLWRAAKSAPLVSWFIEEQFGDQWMIWLEPPIFYRDREKAREIAKQWSLNYEIEAMRTMKWTRRIKHS